MGAKFYKNVRDKSDCLKAQSQSLEKTCDDILSL